jgi:hypothetical protein
MVPSLGGGLLGCLKLKMLGESLPEKYMLFTVQQDTYQATAHDAENVLGRLMVAAA